MHNNTGPVAGRTMNSDDITCPSFPSKGRGKSMRRKNSIVRFVTLSRAHCYVDVAEFWFTSDPARPPPVKVFP